MRFQLFDRQHIFIKILLGIVLGLLIWNVTLNFENDRLISKLTRRIEIFRFTYNKKLIDMFDFTNLIAKTSNNNDRSILETIYGIFDNISKIEDTQRKIERSLLITKKIDVENIENIKKANLLVFNNKRGYSGSGTHIKINNKSYVLTVAHLIKKQGNELIAITDNGDKYPLHYVKTNTKFDLGLFEIDNAENLPYLEISNENPKEGSEVIVIGNPDSTCDVISDGVIAKVMKTRYVVTNITYYGGSGGAVLYKGKIVGVISAIYVAYKPPVFVNYTFCSNIEMIRKFLEDIK